MLIFHGLNLGLGLTSTPKGELPVTDIDKSTVTAIVPCPKCKKKQVYSIKNAFRPFCSERCRTMDTAAWATDEYAIPEKPTDEHSMLEESFEEMSENKDGFL